MRRPSYALSVLAPLCLAGWSACVLADPTPPAKSAEPAGAPSASEVVPDVVATVNGKPLTRDQLAALTIALYGRQTLDTLVSQEVVRQEAARLGITVTREEIEAYTAKRVRDQLDEMARKLGAKNAADLAAKAGRNTDALDTLRKNAEAGLLPFVGPELLARKMIAKDVKVTDEEVRAEFDRQYGPKAKLLQIVLRTRSKAKDVLKQLSQGADFAQLARDVSEDPVSRRANGQIPPVPPGSALGDAAFALKPGQISDVVETPDGFHVLKLVELVPASSAKFDEVKDQLRNELTERTMTNVREKWLNDLLKKADIRRTL
jgi:foldase protein PrsA